MIINMQGLFLLRATPYSSIPENNCYVKVEIARHVPKLTFKNRKLRQTSCILFSASVISITSYWLILIDKNASNHALK